MTHTQRVAPARIGRISEPLDHRTMLADDVRRGLASTQKALPPKYFYDARGSELFDHITRLESYYLTDSELEILSTGASRIMEVAHPRELIELGSGSSRKTDTLLRAMGELDPSARYIPLDISEDAVRAAVERLREDFAWLRVDGYVADFIHDLHLVPRTGPRLVAFLGSTIGNFPPRERERLLGEISRMLDPGDHLLLGVDLEKDWEILSEAYDEPEGVTAAFNRNVLGVVNRELDGNLPVEDFAHRVTWNPTLHCVDMWLEATRQITARIDALDMVVDFAEGERIHTEHSTKFTREGITGELAATGLAVDWWATDSRGWFGLLLARPTP